MSSHFWKRGGGWVLIQWGLMAGTMVAGLVWPADRVEVALRFVAAVLVLAGSFFGIAGALTLGRSRTIFPEPLPGTSLVTSGIFGLVRHPLYTSVIVLSWGWALWWGSLPALVLSLVTTGFLDAKARHEERRLRARFPGYDDYSRRVKRLLPFLY